MHVGRCGDVYLISKIRIARLVITNIIMALSASDFPDPDASEFPDSDASDFLESDASDFPGSGVAFPLLTLLTCTKFNRIRLDNSR
jgi:hypothetical protein